MREYLITAVWDDKECVWTATSDDVKGLCLEATSLDDIIQEAMRLIPELLILNGQVPTAGTMRIPFRISAERITTTGI